MPTNHDETLLQRYQREIEDLIAEYGDHCYSDGMAGLKCPSDQTEECKAKLIQQVEGAERERDAAVSDRELLELAAKAYGLKRAEYWQSNAPDPWPQAQGITHYTDGEPCVQFWAPLDDDGDALRLAVKLRLGIEHNHPCDNDGWVIVSESLGFELAVDVVGDESGRAQATRRAIVRAAAEIGKAHPQGEVVK